MIKGLERPLSKPAVKWYLRMINYWSHYLPWLADMAELICEFTKSDPQVNWTDRHELAFERFREEIIQAQVLRFFDPKLQVIIQCDASSIRLGTDLLQN